MFPFCVLEVYVAVCFLDIGLRYEGENSLLYII